MKARKVKGIDVGGPLADQAALIVAVRLDELFSFVPAALEPGEVEALHDMRIAAKRLRYVLEVTGHCFGPYAERARTKVKELQDLLGEIHDCDELLPRVDALARELRAQDVAQILRHAGGDDDLDPALARRAPHRAAQPGLALLATHVQARRALLHTRFVEMWENWGRQGVRARLEHALGERPPTP